MSVHFAPETLSAAYHEKTAPRQLINRRHYLPRLLLTLFSNEKDDQRILTGHYISGKYRRPSAQNRRQWQHRTADIEIPNEEERCMALLRRHWYNFGGWVALATLIYLAIECRRMDASSALLLMNFVALLLHQFEEYGWPGGEPAIMNMVLQPSDRPDRYPLNQNSAMVVNVLAAYGFYLLPVFFPHVYWLAIGPTFFGFGQFIVHGIVTPKKFGSFYNPGLGAVLFLHFPIGIAYLHHIVSRGSVGVTDWFFGALYMVAFVVITLRAMTYGWLAQKASPYPFAPEEMQRFDVPGKLARREQG